MRYNSGYHAEQNTRALCVSKAARLSQLNVVGKVPSANGYRLVLAVPRDNGSAIRGGHFAMGKLIDETGNRHGRWLVLERSEKSRDGKAYWICRCDCGTERVVQGVDLRGGQSRSCGCLRDELTSKRRALPEEEASFRQLISKYRRNAKSRDVSFELSVNEFKTITQSRCHYCGIEPIMVSGEGLHLNGYYLYNGIDRKDNDKGYTIDNCVAACGDCNRAKRTMKYSDFIEYLDRVAAFRGSNGR